MNGNVNGSHLITFISVDERYVKTDLSLTVNYLWSLLVLITILDDTLDFPQQKHSIFLHVTYRICLPRSLLLFLLFSAFVSQSSYIEEKGTLV